MRGVPNGDMLSADALHHVAEDGDGGDHRERFVGLCGGGSGQRQGEDSGGGCQEPLRASIETPFRFRDSGTGGQLGEITHRIESQRQRICYNIT